MDGDKEGSPWYGIRNKVSGRDFSDVAREERSVEPESVEKVGSPTVPPMQETLAGSISRGNISEMPSPDDAILPHLSEPPVETQGIAGGVPVVPPPIGEPSHLGLLMENVSTHGRS